MAKTDHSKLYQTQISQTEWLSAIDHDQAEAFRLEDNEKRERLRQLNQLINLPFDKPYQYSAQAVADRTPEFEQFLVEHGSELCAMRLIPSDPKLPKLRTRGASIAGSLPWFEQQQVDPSKYRVDFVPHPSGQLWATIFVVNQHGAFGEIVHGSHSQLTQGFYEDEPPMRFSWDFQTVTVTPANDAARTHIEDLLKRLLVTDVDMRTQLAQELEASFAHNYLCGYFETTDSTDAGLWFIDYNRILGKMYGDFTGQSTAAPSGEPLLTGQTGSRGKVQGRVRLIESTTDVPMLPGEILVCAMTTPNHLPYMLAAEAIVTDMGGVLSHAAIVARELGKPCLTATRAATTVLKNGQMIEVDADAGVVRAV